MHPPPSTATESPALTPAQLVDLVGKLERENVQLKRQLAWFQRQIFGSKSEKRHPEPQGMQGILGMGLDAVPGMPLPGKKMVVAGHERECKPRQAGAVNGGQKATLHGGVAHALRRMAMRSG